MPPQRTIEGLCTLVRLGSELFGFHAADVSEIVALSGVHRVPDAPPYVRGVIDLRGHVLPVIDLRVRLGLPSSRQALDELIAVFEAREQDHRRWIDELDASVRERRPFTLTTDPHQCAFGRWYDTLTTDNVVLTAQLKKIDAPHQRIHRRGAEALALAAGGDAEGATAIAADIRTRALAGTLALFAETKNALREALREIVVVYRGARETFAVVVDGIESVERLEEADLSAGTRALLRQRDGVVSTIRSRARDGRLVLLVDPSLLMAASPA